ncbi:MAG: hypothetical protein LQ346_000543 [Caloplaca aetnensis]|nr:MAG: hypothetical protein LQ346_000543 [Caloplaca aetnensis]
MSSPPAQSSLTAFHNSAFRFKRKHADDTTTFDRPPSKRSSHPSHSSHRSYRHRHHHRRHHRSPSLSPNLGLDPEVAFRESLFDALADDEGAAFWEGVYGQPIHTYSPYIPSAKSDDPEQAELQRMTDDEYATYVRARMWEKSHGYIVEERRRREEERIRRKQRNEEGQKWEKGVEEALRRGEQRRRGTRWRDAWKKYLRGWETLSLSGDAGPEELKQRIPWPVETGLYADVDGVQVERFFKHASELEGQGKNTDLGKVLKMERVRWHPDKFVQKAGSHGLDKETIAMVTVIFQIIDNLWSER